MTPDDLGPLVDGVVNLTIAIGGLYGVARLLMWIQLKMLNTAVERTSHLEGRLLLIETRLEEEIDEHMTCRRELNEHKIEANNQIYELKYNLRVLTAKIDLIDNKE